MKYLLTSTGFYTTTIADALVDLVGKPKEEISFGIINEAYAVEEGDKSWVFEELNNYRKHFSGICDLVNLLALTKEQVIERIEQCDVIYVLGGNTDYLMGVFNKSGFGALLSNQFSDKVYVGSSAGSMVMCNRVSTQAYLEIYGENLDFNIDSYLNIFDFAIKPHLNSKEFPNNIKEKLEKVSRSFGKKMICLKDEQALSIVEDRIKNIGGEVFIC
jgi:dipeptidase E